VCVCIVVCVAFEKDGSVCVVAAGMCGFTNFTLQSRQQYYTNNSIIH